MKKKNLLLLPFIAVIGYSLFLWKACTRFADIFYFSSFDLTLRVNEAITNDVGGSIFAVRVFHNKLVGTVIDVLSKLTIFFSPIYLIHLLSIVGFCGFIVGMWYIWKRKDKRLANILTSAVVLFPIVEILFRLSFPFFIRLTILSLPLFCISLYGLWKLCTPEKMSYQRVIFLISLLIISIWWMYVLSAEALKYCIID